ncbi:hypothetical protein [Psychrobacter sanguinis]|uniref:Lipoprotein n=1 Tax=Psychrobacter sanguinis TaxID=861445 RepID=A0A844LYT3_9GAMM|nr:hypothetical protein [Psychrobacter sanguinis]MUG31417.1 hypothetical protein [Psychrobacter sanguinis]
MKKPMLSALTACLILIAGCNAESEKAEPKAAVTNTEDVAPIGHTQTPNHGQAAKLIKKPNFDIKAEDYGNKLNELLANTEFAAMTVTKVAEGDSGDAFIIDYPHHISLTGEVNESGVLEALIYTMPSNEQLEKSGAKLSQLVTASVLALNPKLSPSEAKAKVAELLDHAFSNYILQKTHQRAIGVVGEGVYVCEISEMGVRLLIEPAEGSRFISK